MTVYFDPLAIDAGGSRASARSRRTLPSAGASRAALIDVPVCYGGELGPDLRDVAAFAAARKTRSSRCTRSREYRVYVVGFVPGFAYMARRRSRIAAPRRSSPRTKCRLARLRSPPGRPASIPSRRLAAGSSSAARRSNRSIHARANRFCSARRPRALYAIDRRVRDHGGTLTVVRPGMLTTVQDLGRWGHQASACRLPGRWTYSHRLANRLVGNDDDAAALEVTLVGPGTRGRRRGVARVRRRSHLTVNGNAGADERAFVVPPGGGFGSARRRRARLRSPSRRNRRRR